MSELTQLFGKNVRRIRTARDLTQLELAKAARIDRVTAVKIEKGEYEFSLDMVRKFAAALKVSETELLYSGDVPDPVKILPTPEDALEIIAVQLKAARAIGDGHLDLDRLSKIQRDCISVIVDGRIADDQLEMLFGPWLNAGDPSATGAAAANFPEKK